jgi:hypothetical protein
LSRQSKADIPLFQGDACYTLESRHSVIEPACPLSADRDNSHRSKIEALFDYFVGAQQDRWCHSKAKRVGSFEIDYQLDLGGLLDR